ncbi:hypothetical protein ABW19_dt0208867 [Dactylella cylindrospora]|nr:hypothetical protein ABW19_dt0208867 [Dactylella cylindrospora]
MDNGGSLTSGTLAASITATTTTTGKLYSTGTIIPTADDNGDDHGPTVFATTIVFLVLASVSITLRIIARAVIVRKMRIDDYLILFAYALSFGMCISILMGVNYGFGRHSNTVPYAMAIEKQKYQYAFTLLYNPAIAVTKVSILAFYLLVFKVQRHFRRFCWITMAVVVLAGVALTLVLAFRCDPIGLVFDPESNRAPFPGCIGTVRIYFASAPVNIITALAIIVLPIPVLTALRLPTRQKAILVVVFSLGVFDIVVGIIRIHYFQLTETQTLDFDYNAAYSFMWAAIEVNVGILCASIPMTKPLISRFFPTWLGSVSLSEGNRESTQYDPTYGSGTMLRRGTIGSASRRPSIGVGWLSAYGDSRGGAIGELGHIDEDGKIVTPTSPTRGRRIYPAGRLEAELWDDNEIFITTPPTMPRIPENARENRYGSLGDSGMSGSTAVARQSETDSYLEKMGSSSKSQTPPWEKMELPDLASDDIDPLDRRGMVQGRTKSTDSHATPTSEVPPWEKLELPEFNTPGFTHHQPPSTESISKGKKSAVKFWDRRRSSGSGEKVSSSKSAALSSYTLDAGTSDKAKPERPPIEIPPTRSGPISQIAPSISISSSTDADIFRANTRRTMRTGPEPLLPEPPSLDPLPKPKDPIKAPSQSTKGSSSSGESGEAPLGARKELTDVGELAHEKEIVEPPDATQTPVVEGAPPWESMKLGDVSGKGKAYDAPSSSPEEVRRPSPPRVRSTESSLLKDAIAREQYDKIGSIIDPTTPNSGIVTPAWAKEDDLREDDGDTPPAVIGTSRGVRISDTLARERKLREYFGEENIGSYVDLAPAPTARRVSGDDKEKAD